MRWTGSWHTVFCTVDLQGGGPLAPAVEAALRRHVEPFRLAGHDLELDAPSYVSLELALLVCVRPDYFRSDVHAALLDALGARTLADGRRGLFHPDGLTFGQTIHLSAVYAAARAVPGVASAEVTTFQRQGVPDAQYLAAGRLRLGRLEIARLDDDPNFPEHGVLRLTLRGGK
jgi:hypothetical protein